MFVWSKLSSEKWLDAWEERFSGDSRAVITKITGKPTLRVEVYCEKNADAEEIQKQFGGSIRELKNQNWAAMSSDPVPPVKVRDKLIIVAERDPAVLSALAAEYPKRQIVTIPPDMAFGTGHHATTSTVLRMLVDFSEARKGTTWTMLDLGTGSGVLAIAAEKLGAASAWGFDFDATAVKVAVENVRKNNVENVLLEEGDVFSWKPKTKYDCVVANLFTDILEAVFPKIVRSLKKDGTVLISGILKTQAPVCLQAGEAAGLVFEEVITKGKWVTARGKLR